QLTCARRDGPVNNYLNHTLHHSRDGRRIQDVRKASLFQRVKALGDAAIYLLRKASRTNIGFVLGYLKTLVSDETIFSAIRSHFEVVDLLGGADIRILSEVQPTLALKYFSRGYIGRSFGKKERREIIL